MIDSDTIYPSLQPRGNRMTTNEELKKTQNDLHDQASKAQTLLNEIGVLFHQLIAKIFDHARANNVPVATIAPSINLAVPPEPKSPNEDITAQSTVTPVTPAGNASTELAASIGSSAFESPNEPALTADTSIPSLEATSNSPPTLAVTQTAQTQEPTASIVNPNAETAQQ